jgi:2-polyprenyl-3-methyl-5-hydroxy-6-metoxy-1,4-benzoquinol methylase
MSACWACGGQAEPDPAWLPLRLERCPQCGLRFAPERTAEEVKALYDEGYFDAYPGGESYLDDVLQRRFEAARRMTWVLRHRTGGRLLEIGAAAGHFVEAAAQAGFDPVGIEPAAELAAEARERGLDVRAGFLEDLDLPESSFDVVCAWHVLEHIADPLTALQGLRRVLKPSGALLIEVPNIESVWAVRRGLAWANLDAEHHVAHYTGRALRALLERAGFTVNDTETVSMYTYLRPARALRPIEAAAALREMVVVRSARRRDASRHELLRAVATRA